MKRKNTGELWVGLFYLNINLLYLPVLKPSLLMTATTPQNNVGDVRSLCLVVGPGFPKPCLSERRDGSGFSSGCSDLCDLGLGFEKQV